MTLAQCVAHFFEALCRALRTIVNTRVLTFLSPLRLPISPPGHGREDQYYDTDFEALRPAVKKLGSWWWVGLRWGWVGYLAPCIDVGAASQHRQHAGLLGFETGLCQSCRSLLSWCWRRAGAARFCVGRSACFFPALALHL